eukprot:506380_1
MSSNVDIDNQRLKVLCFTKRGHVAINDKYLNGLFCDKSFTLECWALLDRNLVNQRSHMIIFGQGAAQGRSTRSGDMHFGIYNFNNIGMRFRQNDLDIILKPSELLGYHHYTFSYNHKTKERKIYFDGRLIGTDVANNHLGSGKGLMFGKTPWNDNDDFGGIIRDIRIWDTARTDEQVKEYYNITFKNKSSLNYVYKKRIKLLKECFVFKITATEDAFPDEIFRLITEYDGCGLVACFPLTNHDDINATITLDIVYGYEGALKGNICWVNDPTYTVTLL